MWNLKETTKVVIDQARTATNDDMVESYNAKEDAFDGFLGGVEVPISIIDNLVDVDVMPAPEEGDRKQWNEVFPVYVSLDGSMALIRFCAASHIGKPNLGHNCGWRGLTNEMFYKLADHFVIDNVMTKSEFQSELNGEVYSEPQTEE